MTPPAAEGHKEGLDPLSPSPFSPATPATPAARYYGTQQLISSIFIPADITHNIVAYIYICCSESL